MSKVVTTHKRCGETVENGECPICGSVPQNQLVRERIPDHEEHVLRWYKSALIGFGTATLFEFILQGIANRSLTIHASEYTIISAFVGMVTAALFQQEQVYDDHWRRLVTMRMRELAGYQPYVDDSGEEVA